eukprot:scaffold3028_cov174-Amphora_coffeaeformis.AAC.14
MWYKRPTAQFVLAGKRARLLWKNIKLSSVLVNDEISGTNTQSNESSYGAEEYSEEPAGKAVRERGVPVSGI